VRQYSKATVFPAATVFRYVVLLGTTVSADTDADKCLDGSCRLLLLK